MIIVATGLTVPLTLPLRESKPCAFHAAHPEHSFVAACFLRLTLPQAVGVVERTRRRKLTLLQAVGVVAFLSEQV